MSEYAISIRKAVLDDWDQISRLSSISGYEDYINEMGPPFLNEGTVLVAEDKIIVGFMKISILPDEYAWFSAIRVHPDFRRMGIGDRLMKEALRIIGDGRTKGCRLMIEDSNLKSKGLATKNGFQVAIDLLLFEGGIDTDGLEPIPVEENEFISLGWEFCRYNSRLMNSVHKYMKNGIDLYDFNDEKGRYQLLTGPLEWRISGHVEYTAVLYQDLPESFPLKPVEDFRRSQIFEISF